MCVSEGEKNSPQKSILWSNFIFGKPNKNAYFEICSFCSSFGFLGGRWILKRWMMFILFHPFCSCENLPDFHARARTCTESRCQQDHQLPRVQRREIQPQSAPWPRAQRPCVCPTLFSLDQPFCRNCKPNAWDLTWSWSHVSREWADGALDESLDTRRWSFQAEQFSSFPVSWEKSRTEERGGKPIHIYQYELT